jgi:hypothetical protein
MSKIVIQNLDNVNDFHFAINIFDLTWEIKIGFNAHWYWLGGLIAGLLVISVAASRLKLPDRPTADMQR